MSASKQQRSSSSSPKESNMSVNKQRRSSSSSHKESKISVSKEQQSTSSHKRQKFQKQWLKDGNFSFFVRKVAKTDEKNSVLLDSQGNIIYDDYSFFCNLCNITQDCDHFNRHIFQCSTHIEKTPEDKRMEEQLQYLVKVEEKKKSKDKNKGQESIEKSVQATQQLEDKKLLLKFRLVVFCIKNNLPFIMVEYLTDLFQDLKKASLLTLAGQTKLCRQTATTIAKTGICLYLKQDLLSIMETQFYSLSLDEATDLTGKKFLLIMARYLDKLTLNYETRVYGLLELGDDTSGNKLFEIIQKEVLFNDKLKLNLVGICTDGASNMRSNGELSLTSKLKSAYTYTWSSHDVSHILHLMCKYLLEVLPEILQFISVLPSKFSRSPHLRAKYKKTQRENKVKELEILTYTPTRWGSANKCIARLLSQWEILKDFFLNLDTHDPNNTSEVQDKELNQDEDISETSDFKDGELNNNEEAKTNNSDNESVEFDSDIDTDQEDEEEDNEDESWSQTSEAMQNNNEEESQEMLSKKTSDILSIAWQGDTDLKQFMQFSKIVLELIMRKNEIFSSNQVKITDVSHEILDLCSALCDMILKREASSYTLQELKVIFVATKRLSLKKRKTWFKSLHFKEEDEFMDYLRLRYDSDIEFSSIKDRSNWSKMCMKIIYEAVYRLFRYIPFDDGVMKALSCLRLVDFKPENWIFLVKRFTNMVPKEKFSAFIQDIDKLKRDSTTISTYLVANQFNILTTWKAINDQLNYKVLSDFAFALLSLPVSSVFVERTFKVIKEIKTAKRTPLLPDSLEALLIIRDTYGPAESFLCDKKMIQFYKDKKDTGNNFNQNAFSEGIIPSNSIRDNDYSSQVPTFQQELKDQKQEGEETKERIENNNQNIEITMPLHPIKDNDFSFQFPNFQEEPEGQKPEGEEVKESVENTKQNLIKIQLKQKDKEPKNLLDFFPKATIDKKSKLKRKSDQKDFDIENSKLKNVKSNTLEMLRKGPKKD